MIRLRRAQLARMNVRSLESVENAGATYATAMTLLEEALRLMDTGAAHLRRAHNPKEDK